MTPHHRFSSSLSSHSTISTIIMVRRNLLLFALLLPALAIGVAAASNN
jgi:hypothetical protein